MSLLKRPFLVLPFVLRPTRIRFLATSWAGAQRRLFAWPSATAISATRRESGRSTCSRASQPGQPAGPPDQVHRSPRSIRLGHAAQGRGSRPALPGGLEGVRQIVGTSPSAVAFKARLAYRSFRVVLNGHTRPFGSPPWTISATRSPAKPHNGRSLETQIEVRSKCPLGH